MKTLLSLVVAFAVVLTVGMAAAQQPASTPGPTPYGSPINLEQAKKVMAGAEAEATKNNWPVCFVGKPRARRRRRTSSRLTRRPSTSRSFSVAWQSLKSL